MTVTVQVTVQANLTRTDADKRREAFPDSALALGARGPSLNA